MATPTAPMKKMDNSQFRDSARADLEGETCFLMDLFRERLPLEYNGGSALTQGRKAEPKKERVLVFADSHGFCPNGKTGQQGFSDWTPEDRRGTIKLVDGPLSGLSEAELRREVGSSSWDIIVWGYGCENAPMGCNDPDLIIRLQEDSQRLLLVLCQHLQQNPRACNRLCVLTAGALSIEPAEHREWGLGIITHANLLGFTNSARMELGQTVRVHYVDCPHTPDTMGHDLCSEVYREEGFGTNVVRLNPKARSEKPAQLGTSEGRYVQRMMTSHVYRSRKLRCSHCSPCPRAALPHGRLRVSGHNLPLFVGAAIA
jgi:hypothetical protein